MDLAHLVHAVRALSRWAPALLGLLLVAGEVPAHPLAPVGFALTEQADGAVAARWRQPLPVRAGTNLAPVWPERCQTPGAPRTQVSERAVTLTWRVDCGAAGLEGARVGVSGLALGGINALVQVELRDGRRFERLLDGEPAFFRVPAREASGWLAWNYAGWGALHLASGWDHLAFVAGLFALLGFSRRLAWAVTGFTLGHSLTLAVAVGAAGAVSAHWAELGIALSLVVLALELARPAGAPPGPLRRHPIALSLAFGLLHGLGFADALRQVGLPAGRVPLALVSFNVGIELAQLALVAVLAAAAQAWSRAGGRSVRVDALPATAIGSLGVFWVCERVVALL
ncbi:MAG: HupE/UreJ family protein [Proteobacteria bacterium]|nr:HupE/UreJ family protein [Pseudomonadota bacterium]